MLPNNSLPHERLPDGASVGAWWEPVSEPADDNRPDRIECLLCPRKCRLKDGDRGFCFVRENRDGRMVLSTYGKSTGFCIDPIEKKPLNHFYPGTAVLSFGTAGCNLGCKFCQNWDISKSRETQRLSATAEPPSIAQAALKTGCTSVAYTYNDPVIWAEYAIDTAKACREVGIKNVAVTAGYISDSARVEFFEYMDAANVDLKAFTDEFYEKITYSRLQPVLETLVYLKKETDVWFELTNLIIPQANDNPDDLRRMCSWILKSIGDEVPIHFTAFHPDFRMTDRPRTDPDTLILAQETARSEGLKYAYVGNVHDAARQSTRCHRCSELLISRDWYELGVYSIDASGCCSACGTQIPGRFAEDKGNWGAKRQPIRITDYATVAPSPPETFNLQPPNPASQAQNAPPNSIAADQLQRSTPDSDHPTSAHQLKETIVSESSTTKPADANKETTQTPMHPGARLARNILDLDKLGAAQGDTIRKAAATWFRAAVLQEQQANSEELLGDLSGGIVMGAFVTVKRGNLLRGCCGVLGKPMPLGGALLAAASKTAREDQRMAPISPTELPYLNFDVTLLGPFKKIQAEGTARKDAIEIGKQGLMIQRGERSGLLLPSVAVEREWSPEQFLQGVCQKAGLPISAWESADATVFTFNGKSHGGKLSELVELDNPKPKTAAITKEVLKDYVKIAGDNIVALITGGTPSYVIPHLPDATVNALVISMQWGTRDEDETKDLRQGNLIQVSFRPGVPFQATLYQMCQQAARMFHAQKFSGQLQIGLTVGFDPALHGFGSEADLEGVDTQERGLVISDARHCALAYHADHSADELREKLQNILPIGSREATVHSLQIVTTMPHVVSMSAPIPTRANGTRPPAVAGKFYPAEDAARRAMIGTLFKEEEPPKKSPLAIMVPHAGIKYSGRIAAKVWRSVDEPESRPLIIISPKHTPNGVNWSICPFERWRLSSTTSFDGDPALATKIAESVTPVEFDAAAHQGEHGIEVQLPILERVASNCKVVGMALHSGSWADIQSAAKEFAAVLKDLPEMPLLVISSDMNHYAPEDENRRRDRLALDALATGDPEQLINTCRKNEISMCGQVPAAFVMETLRQLGLDFKVEELDYTTSAEVSGDKSQVVGYAGCLLMPA